jgi:hypothetical protein
MSRPAIFQISLTIILSDEHCNVAPPVTAGLSLFAEF